MSAATAQEVELRATLMSGSGGEMHSVHIVLRSRERIVRAVRALASSLSEDYQQPQRNDRGLVACLVA